MYIHNLTIAVSADKINIPVNWRKLKDIKTPALQAGGPVFKSPFAHHDKIGIRVIPIFLCTPKVPAKFLVFLN